MRNRRQLKVTTGNKSREKATKGTSGHKEPTEHKRMQYQATKGTDDKKEEKTREGNIREEKQKATEGNRRQQNATKSH